MRRILGDVLAHGCFFFPYARELLAAFERAEEGDWLRPDRHCAILNNIPLKALAAFDAERVADFLREPILSSTLKKLAERR